MASNGKFQGREVVIVEAARTPIGRGHEEKGYYKDTHASNLLAKTYAEVIERAGIDASEVEDVVAGCVQQFGEQGINIGRNAWLEAGPADRDAGDDGRPPVRLRPAGDQLRRRARRLRRPRRRDRRRRRAHGPHLVRRLDVGDAGARHGLLAPAAGALQPRPAGDLGRDDRRQVGDPPLRARRDRPALAPARRPRRPRRAASSARSSPSRSTATPTSRTRGRAPTPASRSSSQLKPAFKEDGKVTAGNSSQVSDGAAAVLLMTPREGERARASSRAPRSSTRRPSASTR